MPVKRSAIYWWSAGVFVASVATASLLPATDFFKDLASIPAFGALTAAVWKMWREEVEHERALSLKHLEHDFTLTTASHMAEVAYDKHVLFCEEYVARTNEGLQDLFREGSTEKALEFASDLFGIRTKHRVWLTDDIETALQPFEAALREIGAGEQVLKHVPVGTDRTALVNKVYRAFGLVLGLNQPETDDDYGATATRVIEKIRDILGIRELTLLRQEATRVAVNRLQAGRNS